MSQMALDLPEGWLCQDPPPIDELTAEWLTYERLPRLFLDPARRCMARSAWAIRDGDLWRPAPPFEGDPVLVTPVRGPFESLAPRQAAGLGDIIDLVAWHPDADGAHALRRGHAVVLGCIEPQSSIFSDPVPVWRSVARWWAEGCRGIVFLTGDWRDMQPILCGIDQVQAEDEAHAAELSDIMAWPSRPPFVSIAKTR